MKFVAVAVLLALPSGAAELKPQTMAAFEQYVQQTEQRLGERKSFLWADEVPERSKSVLQGDVVVQRVGAKPTPAAGGGLIHDWVGAIFIPHTTVEKTLAVIQDYNHKEAFRPEVVTSRLVSRKGNDFQVYMRLLKKKVITVVLDTDHDIHYFPIDQTRWRSQSKTTRVAEVQNAGGANERVLPAGTGQGFLWQLYTYWRFEERDGGTWVECQALSLTRDVPGGLGWLINPIVHDLPRESLESTLRHTREAVGK
jgi:hypothetical protein